MFVYRVVVLLPSVDLTSGLQAFAGVGWLEPLRRYPRRHSLLVMFSKQNIICLIIGDEACNIKAFLATTSNPAENISPPKLCSSSSWEPDITGL